jgi:hypothetical protein
VLLADANIASGKTAVAKIPPDSIQPMDASKEELRDGNPKLHARTKRFSLLN